MSSSRVHKWSSLLLLVCLLANYSYGQQEQNAKKADPAGKVVIIKKSTGEDGEVKTERIIRHGDEVQEIRLNEVDGKVIIKEVDVDHDGARQIRVTVDTDDQEIQMNQNVEVQVEEIDGEKHIKVNVQPAEGEGKVFEWKGKGEIPESLRQELEADGIFIQEFSGDEGGDNVFILKKGEEGEDFTWNSIDSDGPFLGIMSDQETKVTVIVDEEGERQTTESEGDEVQGIRIGEVVEGSAAQEAGLQPGDILKSIDGRVLENFSDLVGFMQDAEIGQSVNLSYERDGQLQQTSATLQGRPADMQQNVIIRKRINGDNDLKQDGNVFFFRSDGDEEIKVSSRHKIVVITRGEKAEAADEPEEMLPETLPESALTRSLDLREFNLFPNPTDGKLRLRFRAEAEPTVVRITDLNGKQLYSERLNRFDGQYDQQIDLTDLPAGLLLLTVEQGDQVYTDQIVLK